MFKIHKEVLYYWPLQRILSYFRCIVIIVDFFFPESEKRISTPQDFFMEQDNEKKRTQEGRELGKDFDKSKKCTDEDLNACRHKDFHTLVRAS